MSTLADKQVSDILSVLNEKAAIDHRERQHRKTTAASSGETFDRGWDTAYLAVTEEQGRFLNFMARAVKARNMVEFGCSFGISTIYLAAAAKDNGGKVVTTDIEPNKVAGATKNLEEAGLRKYVEIRLGDALQTLADVEAPVDLLFMDGAKDLYPALLGLLQSKLKIGAVVLFDNADKPELASFVSSLENPDSAYTVSKLFDGRLLAAVYDGN